MTNLEKVLQYAKLKYIHLYPPTKKSEDKLYKEYYQKNEAYRTSVNCIGVTRNNMELSVIHNEFPNITRLDSSQRVYDLYIIE